MVAIDQKEDGLAAQWVRSRRLARLCLRSPHNIEASAQVCALEDAVLTGPIRTIDDAIAKLRAVALLFIDGERTDGADEAALDQAIHWLESQRRAACDPIQAMADRRLRQRPATG